MNNFTKDELLEIEDMLEEVIANRSADSFLLSLYAKTQTMIDNYCEHKKDVVPVYTVSGDIPIAGFCYECDSPVDVSFIDE